MECTEELYQECTKRIMKVVWTFYKKYRSILSFEDLLAEANFRFVYSWEMFHRKEGEANFTTYMTRAVNNGLCELVRKELNYRKRRKDLPERPLEERFDVKNLMMCLSEDASKCVGLSIKPNLNMSQYCAKKIPKGRDFRPSDIRKALSRYLRDVGWTASQIMKAFKEVKESLL